MQCQKIYNSTTHFLTQIVVSRKMCFIEKLFLIKNQLSQMNLDDFPAPAKGTFVRKCTFKGYNII